MQHQLLFAVDPFVVACAGVLDPRIIHSAHACVHRIKQSAGYVHGIFVPTSRCKHPGNQSHNP